MGCVSEYRKQAHARLRSRQRLQYRCPCRFVTAISCTYSAAKIYSTQAICRYVALALSARPYSEFPVIYQRHRVSNRYGIKGDQGLGRKFLGSNRVGDFTGVCQEMVVPDRRWYLADCKLLEKSKRRRTFATRSNFIIQFGTTSCRLSASPALMDFFLETSLPFSDPMAPIGYPCLNSLSSTIFNL